MTVLGAILLDLDTVVLDLFDATTGGTINATTGRSGGNSLRIATSAQGCSKTLSANQGTLNVAFAWLPASLASPGASGVLTMTDAGTAQVTFKVLADGTVQAYRGTTAGTLLGASGVGAITASTYQHVEASVTISATVGVVSVWVNGVSVLSLTAQNTKSTGNSTVSGFTISAPGTANHDFCDIIFSTARINDCRVECFVPTGAGTHTDFTPSTGANWQNVDEVPPNSDTDFNSSSTVNHIDTFVHGALTSAPLSILAVVVQARARNTTSGTGSIAPVVRSGTTDSVGTAVALNTTYQDAQTVYETDPNTSAAWASAAAVNAAEIGYKKVS